MTCHLHHEQGMLLDIQSHVHFHQTIIHAIQDEFYALARATLQRIHFPLVESKIMDKYFIYKFMKSSNTSGDVDRSNNSLSEGFE